jgi:FkbH-like protein
VVRFDVKGVSNEPRITHRAVLAWAEHCIECAAPACYTTCDLYSPTAAGKCRRFEDGIIPNRYVGGPDGPAAEVRFKKWGKLEAQGNAALLPVGQARFIEGVLTAVSPMGSRAGRVVARLTGSQKWATAMEALHKRLGERLQRRPITRMPNAFVAELYNPGETDVRAVLLASVDKARLARPVPPDQLPRPLVLSINAPPGPSKHVLSLEGARELISSGLPFNLSLSPADGQNAHLIFRRMDLVALEEPTSSANEVAAGSAASKPAKLVIFDLDNTLWEGVLLEGEIKLRHEVRDLFRKLDERGILISVASKNSHDDAMSRLEDLGLSDYILYPRIGWGPKSEGVSSIVKSIDIGSDTVIFVDDNPFERAEVCRSVAGVEALSEDAISTLADHPRLQGAVTAESRSRRQMYREAMVREQTAESYGEDYLKFLRDCEITVTIRRDQEDDFDRIVELVQRTNQLNFSGRKYDRSAISEILRDPSRERHVVACRDKFGAYGTVGFCLSSRDGDAVVVEDFMLSCRVQGKFIEQALFWRLAEASARPPAKEVIVNFQRTDRNRAAEMVLEKLGFAPTESGQLGLRIAPGDLAVDFLRIEP